MFILDYKKKYHQRIINSCVHALRQGKVVAYPTDTCYGLAVDADNLSAIKKLYRLKGRNFNKPSSVVAPSLAYAKKITRWNPIASKLARRWWPGAITIVSGIRVKGLGYRVLSGGQKTIGLRMPKNNIALDLAKELNRPITATSANVSGMPDCYSAKDVITQFKHRELKPDIIINAGKLPKRRPSTVVKIDKNQAEILRAGPISKKQILKALYA